MFPIGEFSLGNLPGVFSRTRSKGSRFTLRVCGLRVCSLNVAKTVRNRSQPFATVRHRSQPFATVCNRSPLFATVRSRSQPFARAPYGRAYGISTAKGVTFGGCTCRVASFRVALRDIQTCFVTCGKSFRVAGAILLRRFRKISCNFRGRRNALETIIVILRGRRNTLDVSCGSFCANRIVRAA